MPDENGINRTLVHYFEQLANSVGGDQLSTARACLVGFVQQKLNEFNWKDDISTEGSERQDGEDHLGKLRSSWRCSPVPLINKENNTVEIAFLSILEQSCGNDYYDQSVYAKAIFIIETGAFLGFTDNSLQTNRLEAFCSSLHYYSI